MKRIAIIIALFTAYITALYSQEDVVLDKVVDNITRQLLVFPHEKIYLHTDKPYYISGEKIFFRAFLLDAFSNKQDTLSRYVYVELINPEDSVEQRVKIRPDENYLFHGAIPLRENLPQGDYMIRAYTQYMQNQGESAFFSKQVRIGDPQILKEISAGHYEDETRSNPVEMNDFDVGFYPEGGHLITGQLSEVAFKALSADGTPLNITGEIVDSKGNIVTGFKTVHNGMGNFFINPLPDEHYRAVCYNNGHSLRFDLPDVQPGAVALKVINRDGKLRITVNKPEPAALPDLYLLIHSRGSVVYAGAWDSAKNYIAFDSSVFPSGIGHVILLTKDLQIVSERLIFLLNDDHGLASFQTEKNACRKREKIRAQIQLKDEKQPPLKGNFSIAVTNDKEVVVDTTTSILSEILLYSELKGHVQNPEYYFRKGNKEAEQAADLLMKTHGWTRYSIPDVIRGKLTYPGIPFETSQRIAGTVKSGTFSKPAKNARLSIMSMNHHFFEQIESDKNGCYVFRDFEFPDSTKYVIQALNSKGKGSYMMELYFDKDTFPDISLKWTKPIFKERNHDSVFMDYMAKADQQYMFEHGMRVINLSEIQITGIRKDQNKYTSPFYGEPDYYMPEEKIKNANAVYFIDLLYHIPGIYVANGAIMIRGINSLSGVGTPLILIDGIEFNGDVNMINVNDIGQVDVIKDGASLTGFGSKGMFGVISIHSKKGITFNGVMPDNIKTIVPLGYQLPVEFYSPKYETRESIDNPIPDLRTTIYWKPNVITDDKGNVELDFYTADDPGTYSVVIEGVSEDGKLIHYHENSLITVK